MNARGLARACVIVLLSLVPAWLLIGLRDLGYLAQFLVGPANAPYILFDVVYMLGRLHGFYVLLPLVLEFLLVVIFFRLRGAERFARSAAATPTRPPAESTRPAGEDHAPGDGGQPKNRPAGVGGTPDGP
jgi:hypothetical protein